MFWVSKNHFPRGKIKTIANAYGQVEGGWPPPLRSAWSLISRFLTFPMHCMVHIFLVECGRGDGLGGSRQFSRWMGQKINWIQTSTTSSFLRPDFDKIPSYNDSMGNCGNWEAAIVLQSMTASTWKLTILSMCVLLVLTGAREGVVMQQQSALSPPLPIHDSSVCREIGWQGTLFVDDGGVMGGGVLIKRGGSQMSSKGKGAATKRR